MSDKRLRFIIAGCGRLSRQVHLANLARMQGAEVVAIVDPLAESLEAARRLTPRAATFTGLEEALAKTPSEAVLIASPSDQHVPMALMALDAGRHVYLEKPIATDREGASALLHHPGASERLMVGFNYRFHPLVREVRQCIGRGALGDIVGVRTVFSTAEANPPAWKTKRGSGGGALLDLATHDIDLIRFISGQEIVAVQAMIGSRHGEDDTAALLLELEGGAMAQCVVMSGCAETARMEVVGESGGASFERYRSSRVEYMGKTVGGLGERLKAAAAEVASFPRRLTRLRHPWNEPSFAAALEAFAKVVREGTSPRPGIDDGVKSLEVLLAAEEAARSGTRIEINIHASDHG